MNVTYIYLQMKNHLIFSDTSIFRDFHCGPSLSRSAQLGPAGAVVVQGTLLHRFAQGGVWMHRARLDGRWMVGIDLQHIQD